MQVPIPTVIVGDATYPGDYIRGLRAAAPQSVVFTGYQYGAAYQQLTAHAAVFILAAEVGGTHPVLVEQMAAGNCILARDTGSNREVLGEAGVIWRTPGELAECLRVVIADTPRRQAMGQAAGARQRQHYDWQAVTESYARVCAEVVG
jgi:glycosyltransferase involved in cell wall biosynthesis